MAVASDCLGPQQIEITKLSEQGLFVDARACLMDLISREPWQDVKENAAVVDAVSRIAVAPIAGASATVSFADIDIELYNDVEAQLLDTDFLRGIFAVINACYGEWVTQDFVFAEPMTRSPVSSRLDAVVHIKFWTSQSRSVDAHHLGQVTTSIRKLLQHLEKSYWGHGNGGQAIHFLNTSSKISALRLKEIFNQHTHPVESELASRCPSVDVEDGRLTARKGHTIVFMLAAWGDTSFAHGCTWVKRLLSEHGIHARGAEKLSIEL